MGRWMLVLVALTVWRSDVATAETWSSPLHVRVYDNTQLPPDQLTAALDSAGDVLASIGLAVQWHGCSTAARVASESRPTLERAPWCGEPLAMNELALRVVHAPTSLDYRGQLPLGDSLIDQRLGIGVLATIYFERVEWLARAADVPVTPLLARAIAHEIGHLLLGSPHHASTGLMRPVWRREDLQHEQPDDWKFTAADANAIRARRPGYAAVSAQ
jgi:hypothetical protein